MRKSWGLIQEITRFYTFHSPFRKGKYRLASLAANFAGETPEEILTETFDGRKLLVNPAPFSYQTVYFLGEYERAVTEVISKVVREGDVCLDIGANIGWYTTLLQKKVGANGSVHAFEPMTHSYAALEKNVKLNSSFENIYLNNFALGDSEKEVEIFVFDNLPDGHASLSKFENREYESSTVQMKTLDSYLKSGKVGNVNFVKADIEGAELFMLEGAKKLFKQAVPPIWVIEMALGTTKGFDYLPNDLIEFIKSQSEYDFYAIDEINARLIKIEGFAADEIGANVLCVPKNQYRERLSELKIVG
ncbi:MAG: FkbM family methyltransferase [Pyrinomonadaceae bacterium]